MARNLLEQESIKKIISKNTLDKKKMLQLLFPHFQFQFHIIINLLKKYSTHLEIVCVCIICHDLLSVNESINV